MPTTRRTINGLRELAAWIEQEGIVVYRFAAAGNETDVVINIRVTKLGDALVEAINQPQSSARQRMLRLMPPSQTEIELENDKA